jgi:hypothetical protein
MYGSLMENILRLRADIFPFLIASVADLILFTNDRNSFLF